MHSSGMRTARLLTVSQHALRRGVCPGVCGRHPPVDRMTDMCKYIVNLAAASLRAVKTCISGS